MIRELVCCALVVVVFSFSGACKRGGTSAGRHAAGLVNTALQVKEQQEEQQAEQAARRSIDRFIRTEEAKKTFLDQCHRAIAYLEQVRGTVDGDVLAQVAAFKLEVAENVGQDIKKASAMMDALEIGYGDFMAAQAGRTGLHFSQQLGRTGLTAGAKHLRGPVRDNLIELRALEYHQTLLKCLDLSYPGEATPGR